MLTLRDVYRLVNLSLWFICTLYLVLLMSLSGRFEPTRGHPPVMDASQWEKNNNNKSIKALKSNIPQQVSIPEDEGSG